ncbi:MAG: protein kinase [Rubripirellula sp.]
MSKKPSEDESQKQRRKAAADQATQSPGIIDEIGQTLGCQSRIQLTDDSLVFESPLVRVSDQSGANHSGSGRYQIEGEIARGGMGVVLKARDTELGRDLAIKSLLKNSADSETALLRFVEEAQINGQLQHPGIAPVYDVGRLPDKRPFFSMKLVKGKTLAALLAERRTVDEDRQKLLGIFHQVCQAVGYAHSRHVIHRDLKPANIMVGAFGEVQVMDWGLAKVLGSGGVADEQKAKQQLQVSVIQTLRSTGSGSGSTGSQTEHGSVIGTPAYMPPEQAIGDVDLLDERADVFGLGAILAEILTGQAPFVGDSLAEVHRKAARCDTAGCLEKLSENCNDPALQTLVQTCLQPEARERFANAGLLAKELTAYFEGVQEKLVQAKVEQAAQQARTEEALLTAATERRRKRSTVAFVVAASLGLVTLASATALVYQQRSATLAAEAESVRAKAEVTQAKRQEEQKLFSAMEAEFAVASEILDRSSGIEPPRLADLDRADAALANAEKLRAQTSEIPTDRFALAEKQLANVRDSFQMFTALENHWAQALEQSTVDKSRSTAAEKDAASVPANRPIVAIRKIFSDHGLSNDRDSIASASEWLESKPRWLKWQVLTSMVKSCTVQATKSRDNENEFTDWLRNTALDYETDPWRRKVINAILEDDMPAMLALATDGQIDSQPNDYLLLLSQTLLERGQLYVLDQYEQEELWETVSPIETWQSDTTKLTTQQDGSILVEGPSTWTESLTLTFPTKGRKINALRLDTICDERLPKQGPGRSDSSVNLAIREIRLYPNTNPNKRAFASAMEISSITSSHLPRSINQPFDAIDKDFDTAWFAEHRKDQTTETAVLQIEPQTKPTPFALISITSGARVIADNATLGRFRLSVSYRDWEPTDPRLVAEELLDRVFSRNQESYRLAIAMAQSFASQSPPRVDEALRYASVAAALAPDNPIARQLIVRFSLTNNPDSDSRIFRVAIQNAREFKALTGSETEILRVANSQIALGDLLFLRDRAKSIKALTLAMDLKGGSVDRAANIGYQLNSIGQTDEAIRWFEKGIAANSRDPYLYTHYASLLNKIGKPEESLANYKRAEELSPKNITALAGIALAYKAKGQLREAIRYFEKAIEEKDSATYRLYLATTNIDLKDYPTAIEHCIGTLRLREKDYNATKRIVYCLTMMHADDSDKLIEAIQEHEHLQDLEPGIVDATIADLLDGSIVDKDPPAALRLANVGIELSPEEPRAFRSLALAMLDNDDLAQAKESAEKALQLDEPDSANALLMMALIMKRSDELKEFGQWMGKFKKAEDEHGQPTLKPDQIQKSEIFKRL